jgi:thiamine biosynthesis lipoprotein
MNARGIFRHPIALVGYLLVVAAVAFVVARRWNTERDAVVTRTQIAMGTVVEIQLRGMSEEEARPAMDAAFAEIRRVDTLFSTYVAGPVWRLNHAGDTVAVLPDELHALLRRCDTLWRGSDGAFDIAIERLVEAWGFGSDAPGIPAPDVLREARERSGWRHVTLLDSNTVRLANGVGINFGAIAKGYGVDRAVAVLRNHGANDALVNAGGEVRCTGGQWIVGVQHPREQHRLVAALRSDGRAIATSGDYEQYFEVNGQRYHHIFDPATGQPARGCRSVTILAPDDMTADALATAVFVMGPSKGMEFLRRQQHIDGMIVDDRGRVSSTPGFDRHIQR